uniref:Uncharacterized protein n=1 Tax=Oryza barthii TaxID=65489 RepID=A0A0D3GN77_9ORYZ
MTLPPSVSGSGGGGDLEAHLDGDVGNGNARSDSAAAAAAAPELRYRGWKAMPFVIGNETFEKLGSIGTAANLMVYLTTVFHMSSLDAAVALNVFAGTTNLATVVGAFASDLYLGRYATVAAGCVSTFIGMVILTMTAGVPALHPPPCGEGRCLGATRGQLAVLGLAFAFISAFWLVPQLAALGLSEAFNQVSQTEFYYREFPESMRSVAGSVLFSGLALSSYLSGVLVAAVERATRGAGAGDDGGWLAEDLNKGRLDWFYLLIAAIGAANFLAFVACAKWYRYKGSDDDDDDDHEHEQVNVADRISAAAA